MHKMIYHPCFRFYVGILAFTLVTTSAQASQQVSIFRTLIEKIFFFSGVFLIYALFFFGLALLISGFHRLKLATILNWEKTEYRKVLLRLAIGTLLIALPTLTGMNAIEILGFNPPRMSATGFMD